MSATIFSFDGGTRHTPILFSLVPFLSLSLSLSLSLVDAVGEITHFENACQPVRLSIAATSGIHDNV